MRWDRVSKRISKETMALVNYSPRKIGKRLREGGQFYGVTSNGYRERDSWTYVEDKTLNLYIAPIMLALTFEDNPRLVFRRSCRIERRLKVELEELQGIRNAKIQIDYIKPNLPPLPGK